DFRGRHEPVAARRHRLDKPWRRGIVAERRPQLRDAEVQAALEVDVDVVSPQRVTDFLPRDDRARTREQQVEQPRGPGLQRHAHAVTAQLAAFRGELEGAKACHNAPAWRSLASSILPAPVSTHASTAHMKNTIRTPNIWASTPDRIRPASWPKKIIDI